MANDTVITVIGNLTADPELKPVGNGVVANFTIASTPRTFDRNSNEWKDGETLFLNSSVWREQAEHVTDSLRKGARVIAQGRLKQRSWEKDGQRQSRVEFEVDEIGPSLKNATATVTKSAPNGGNSGGFQQNGAQQPASAPQNGQWGQQAPAPAQWGNQPQNGQQWGQQANAPF